VEQPLWRKLLCPQWRSTNDRWWSNHYRHSLDDHSGNLVSSGLLKACRDTGPFAMECLLLWCESPCWWCYSLGGILLQLVVYCDSCLPSLIWANIDVRTFCVKCSLAASRWCARACARSGMCVPVLAGKNTACFASGPALAMRCV
jgi:hypothetical protein